MSAEYCYNLGIAFNAVAAAHRERPALRFMNGKTATYGELAELAGKFAGMLHTRGLGCGNVAAIFNEKTPRSYAIMLACLKTGVTYTNLDPNSPAERLNKMLSLCRPAIVFCGNATIDKVSGCQLNDAELLNYDAPSMDAALAEEEPFSTSTVNGNTPAYLMFTSGSTGFPKGAIITHANVLNFIRWSQSTFHITSADVLTNLNPMHFDNSVFDFYSALFSGASLIPIPEEAVKNPRRLLDSLNQLEPTLWFSVPSLLVYVLKMRALKDNDLPRLKTVSFGGEGFPKNQLRNLWNVWGKRVRFVNVYGPTECTCICSSYDVSDADMADDELLPLGPVAPNFGFAVIDPQGRQVPDGELGELYLTGPNVGKGYYHNPQKTVEAFIQHPGINSHPEIVYRTGDLVRYDRKRNLFYFCGRRDNQIKRMGYRIELEEIENALSTLNYIEENAVVYHKTDDNNGRIIACVAAQLGDEQKILADLRELLPSYMIPNDIKFMNSLPKNRNGKIDRLALKEEFCQ